MQNKLLPVLVAAALLTAAARAEDTQPAPVPAPPTSAPAAAPVTVAPAAPAVAPAPSQVIYAPRLPGASELAGVAAAQGLTIEQISQTATQVTVIYRNSAGQATSVAYQLLPTPGTPAPQTTVVAPTPAPTVIYETTPRVMYYETYDPYWPRYYSPPVSLQFGFGYYHGWGHGGHRHWR